MLAACLLCLAIAIPVYAVNAEVYADVVHASGETVAAPLSIRDNPGLMGFKLIVKYDSSILQPQTVTRGTVTQTGMMNDSIGAGKSGTLLIVWSGTDAVKADGTLAVLTFKASKQTDTRLTVSYSQADTFGGDFNDVTLDCKPVEIRFGSEVTTTMPMTKQPDNRDIIAAVDGVEDKTDVSAVNEAVKRLTGTEDLYSTPEEVQSTYSAAVADYFVETALLAVDSEQIDTAIQNALREVGAETVDAVPAEKQTEFVQAVETALRAEVPDVPTISDSLPPDAAVQVVETLQAKSKEAASSGIPIPEPGAKNASSRSILFCCIGAAVLVVTAAVLFWVYRRKKHKEEISE